MRRVLLPALILSASFLGPGGIQPAEAAFPKVKVSVSPRVGLPKTGFLVRCRARSSLAFNRRGINSRYYTVEVIRRPFAGPDADCTDIEIEDVERSVRRGERLRIRVKPVRPFTRWCVGRYFGTISVNEYNCREDESCRFAEERLAVVGRFSLRVARGR